MWDTGTDVDKYGMEITWELFPIIPYNYIFGIY
jgi:hypothetical protein